MARNEEKSQSMLGRYLQTKKGESNSRRPYLSTLCDDVDEAQKWRNQILGDIRRLVSEIQNPGLDDVRLRELNDSINKLLREKKHWERRIVFLGGKDVSAGMKGGREKLDNNDDIFEHNGYFYFGAARNLPGVQELMDRHRGFRNSRAEEDNEESASLLYHRVDIEYYGYLDDHDGSLCAVEQQAEAEYEEILIQEWEEDKGPEPPWDDNYLDFIGKKPALSLDTDLQAVVLERRKLEALEQLHSGLQKP